MQPDKTFSAVVRITTVLAFIVVVLGAYVRLSHAGLGCPDWPGCYGKLIMPVDEFQIDKAYSDRPLEHGKAWKEMIHRYAAGMLGLLIFFIAVMAWCWKISPDISITVPFTLVFLVILQALLGMWTVTLLLKPVIVMAHLLGGMTIISLLWWLMLSTTRNNSRPDSNSPRLIPWAVAGLVMVVIQISLGGWTSANYSALVCPDFPTCQGAWWPEMDFREGFIFWRGLGVDYEGGILHGDARTAIHMTHRIGAMLTALIVSAVAIRAIMDKNKMVYMTGIVMMLVLIIQIALGIANVLMRLPLPIAVAHNGVAALLLLSLVALLHQSVTCGTSRRVF